MTSNSYFTLNSGLRVGVKYLARCLLTDLLMGGVVSHFPTMAVLDGAGGEIAPSVFTARCTHQ